ncbi:MAG: hypothetical protein AB1391_04245 [Candidatus Micrarchaeota archaeon]
MQLIESVLSLLTLISLSILLLLSIDTKIDNSLYKYELQGDVKNIIYLKGGFENISKGNKIANEIFEKTGMCIEMDKTEITSYIVGEKHISTKLLIPVIKSGNLTNFTSDEFFFGECALVD